MKLNGRCNLGAELYFYEDRFLGRAYGSLAVTVDDETKAIYLDANQLTDLANKMLETVKKIKMREFERG